jgi:hypothetical protein
LREFVEELLERSGRLRYADKRLLFAPETERVRNAARSEYGIARLGSDLAATDLKQNLTFGNIPKLILPVMDVEWYRRAANWKIAGGSEHGHCAVCILR